MHVFLIGYMGSGKSTVGARLAALLNRPWADTDNLLAKKGRSVAELIAKVGEDRFRVLESECLRALLIEPHTVISTGGGTPCFNGNLDWMRRNGLVIYLTADVALLASRLESSMTQRPMLKGHTGDALKSHIAEHLAEREYWYRQADVMWDAARSDLNELANIILSTEDGQSR